MTNLYPKEVYIIDFKQSIVLFHSEETLVLVHAVTLAPAHGHDRSRTTDEKSSRVLHVTPYTGTFI